MYIFIFLSQCARCILKWKFQFKGFPLCDGLHDLPNSPYSAPPPNTHSCSPHSKSPPDIPSLTPIHNGSEQSLLSRGGKEHPESMLRNSWRMLMKITITICNGTGAVGAAHLCDQTACRSSPTVSTRHLEGAASMSAHIRAQTQNSASVRFTRRIHSHTSMREQWRQQESWAGVGGDKGGGYRAQPTAMPSSGLPQTRSAARFSWTVPSLSSSTQQLPRSFLSPLSSKISALNLSPFCYQLASATVLYPDL